VIHRDLKLADFGLSAKFEDDDDKRMHLFMLTGKQPFQSKDKRSTYKKIQQVCYSWPSQPVLSSAAKNFVETALQKDRRNRPSAADLLRHPFILTQDVEMPLEPVSEGPVDVIRVAVELALPPYAVRIWWDYSHRYGLAYLLHNGVCGACFNDNSRILMTPDELIAQYWETPQTPNPDILPLKAVDESPIRKKLLLVKHFASELKQRAGEMKVQPLKMNIQANFSDHTKLVIESNTKVMFYDTGHGVKRVTMANLSDREHVHDVRKRFAFVKEMARHLV
jgi:polo-like kinase 1